jgi:hypothetical protein
LLAFFRAMRAVKPKAFCRKKKARRDGAGQRSR